MLPTPSRLTRLLSCTAIFAALAFFSAEARAQRTIIIDPGHGGFDRGGVPGQRIQEKQMTLDVSQRLRRILESSGYRVVMTRNSDVFIPLGGRTGLANRYRGATFVSIHFNSARREGANGIETYYYRGDSANLAANIHRQVMAVAPTENRGIRRRGYFVLRRTAVPSVLCELGFLTNSYEGRLALNPSYRQRLAEAVARGIQGQRAPMSRPLSRASAASVDVLPQALSGPDFVRPAPRPRVSRSSRSSRRSSKYSRSRSRSKSSKRSTSSKRKKKRSSSVPTIIYTNAAFA